MRLFKGLLLVLLWWVGVGAEELVNCRLLGRPGLHRVRLGSGRILSIDGKTRDGQRFDCRGGYLLPGFIDAHVHLGLSEPAAVVRGGVTSVRDLGWEPRYPDLHDIVAMAWRWHTTHPQGYEDAGG